MEFYDTMLILSVIIFVIIMICGVILSIVVIIKIQSKRFKYDLTISKIAKVDSMLIQRDNFHYKNLTFGTEYSIIDIAYPFKNRDYLIKIKDDKKISLWVSSVYFIIEDK